jgi:hypothetical protein
VILNQYMVSRYAASAAAERATAVAKGMSPGDTLWATDQRLAA